MVFQFPETVPEAGCYSRPSWRIRFCEHSMVALQAGPFLMNILILCVIRLRQ
jgi:hypothetical protein